MRQKKSSWQQALNCRFIRSDVPAIIQGIGIAILFGRLFYDSWIAVAFVSPLVLVWVCIQRKKDRERDIRLVGIQFKDAMISVLAAMKAGYSVENAFMDALGDMEVLYGKKSLICMYLHRIRKGIRNNIPIEKLLENFGKECGNVDVQDFAEVFSVAKRSGGNMTSVTERTIGMISGKLDVEKEIDVLISARRMEARIMNCVPFFIILYISLTSRDFFDPLYHNVYGVIVMTVCMAVYVAAYLLSEKIVNIKV